MKKIKLFLLILLAIFELNAIAQNRPLNAYVIGFYNLENLFDTIDDPIKIEHHFLTHQSFAIL